MFLPRPPMRLRLRPHSRFLMLVICIQNSKSGNDCVNLSRPRVNFRTIIHFFSWTFQSLNDFLSLVKNINLYKQTTNCYFLKRSSTICLMSFYKVILPVYGSIETWKNLQKNGHSKGLRLTNEVAKKGNDLEKPFLASLLPWMAWFEEATSLTPFKESLDYWLKANDLISAQ